MKSLLFDIDGVLYLKGRAIKGAAEVIHWAEEQQIPFRFVTNTTSRSCARICSDLSGAAIPVSEEQIITPPVAARLWLQQQGIEQIQLLVPQGIRREFSGVEDKRPQAVVMGDMGAEFTFDKLNSAFRTLMENPDAQLVALGMTRYFAAADGLQLDVGPFVKALEYATGKSAVVMGKPAAGFFQLALDAVQAEAAETLMIGDDRVGDVLAAQACGMRACLVRTGKYRAGDEDADEQGSKPQYVIDSVADVPALWSSLS